MFVTILSHCFVVYSAGWVRSLTAPGSVFVHRCISLPLKTPRQSHVAKSLVTWVDEYGTGSGPGSPDGQPGWGGGSDRLQPAMHKSFNARALRKQRVRQRWSTNTEPGADRGPQTGSPAGVVVATGPNVQYTKRSMREFRDEHRDIHNRLSCKGICNQTSSRSLSLPVPYLCIAASRFR